MDHIGQKMPLASPLQPQQQQQQQQQSSVGITNRKGAFKRKICVDMSKIGMSLSLTFRFIWAESLPFILSLNYHVLQRDKPSLFVEKQVLNQA